MWGRGDESTHNSCPPHGTKSGIRGGRRVAPPPRHKLAQRVQEEIHLWELIRIESARYCGLPKAVNSPPQPFLDNPLFLSSGKKKKQDSLLLLPGKSVNAQKKKKKKGPPGSFMLSVYTFLYPSCPSSSLPPSLLWLCSHKTDSLPGNLIKEKISYDEDRRGEKGFEAEMHFVKKWL